MALNNFTGCGQIVAINEIQTKTGKKMVKIRIPVNDPGPQEEGKEEKTVWCDLTAFDETADRWLQQFREKDVVTFQGRLRLNPYKDRDGEPRASAQIEFARIEHTPKGRNMEARDGERPYEAQPSRAAQNVPF